MAWRPLNSRSPWVARPPGGGRVVKQHQDSHDCAVPLSAHAMACSGEEGTQKADGKSAEKAKTIRIQIPEGTTVDEAWDRHFASRQEPGFRRNSA